MTTKTTKTTANTNATAAAKTSEKSKAAPKTTPQETTAPKTPPKTKNTAPKTEAAPAVETAPTPAPAVVETLREVKAEVGPIPAPAPVVAAAKSIERITLKGVPATQVQEVLASGDFGATVDALCEDVVKAIRAGGEVIVAVNERGAVEMEAKTRLQRGSREAVRAQFVPRYNPMTSCVELTNSYSHATYFPGLDHEDTRRLLDTYAKVYAAGEQIVRTLDADTINTLVKTLIAERAETVKFVREAYGQMAFFAALGQLDELMPIQEGPYQIRNEGERYFWHTAVALLDGVHVPDDIQGAAVKLREAAARYSDRKALYIRTSKDALRERRDELADTFKVFAHVAEGVVHASYAAETEFKKMVREAVEAVKPQVEAAMEAQIARYAAEDEAEALRPKLTRNRRTKEEIEAERAEQDAKREQRRLEIEAKKAAKNGATPGALVGNTPSLPDYTPPAPSDEATN